MSICIKSAKDLTVGDVLNPTRIRRNQGAEEQVTVQVIATSNADGGYKRFSGAGANGRDLKRWKTWCLSKMITMTTLPKEARGPFVYSMLDGDALTAVEHWEFAEFAVDGGEHLICNMLEARYPHKDPIDREGKALFDVFDVSAKEGKRLSEWSARAESVFHACQRDAGIAFPDMVKGYLCLHRCGLSDDQRAVVLGTGGKYEIALIAPALLSCFPEYRVPKLNRRSHGVFVSEMPIEEEEEEEIDEDASTDDLEDVEKFIKEGRRERRYHGRRRSSRGAGDCVETKTTRNFKRETSSRV